MKHQSDLHARAAIDGLDATARQMESKWGVDRLRLLVGQDLRVKFDRQREHLHAAFESDDQEQIVFQAQAMQRGWLALDAAATAAGAEPLSPDVWQVKLPCGDVVGITRTTPEAIAVCGEVEIWTLDEIATLIERLGRDIRNTKRLFPGAMVKAREPVDWSVGDPIDDLGH